MRLHEPHARVLSFALLATCHELPIDQHVLHQAALGTREEFALAREDAKCTGLPLNLAKPSHDAGDRLGQAIDVALRVAP